MEGVSLYLSICACFV